MNDGAGFTLLYHKEATSGGVRKTEYPDFRAPFYPNFSRMRRIR